jgi:hypothetical protein
VALALRRALESAECACARTSPQARPHPPGAGLPCSSARRSSGRVPMVKAWPPRGTSKSYAWDAGGGLDRVGGAEGPRKGVPHAAKPGWAGVRLDGQLGRGGTGARMLGARTRSG